MADPFWRDVPGPQLYDTLGSPIVDPITGMPVYGPPVPAPPPVDTEAVRPTVDDIAKLERTRTVGPGGNDLPSFDTTTRPTSDEVDDLIDNCLLDVLGQLPPCVDPMWYPAIAHAVALRTASTLETSFFRESQSNVVSQEWDARFLADLTALRGLIPRATRVA